MPEVTWPWALTVTDLYVPAVTPELGWVYTVLVSVLEIVITPLASDVTVVAPVPTILWESLTV